MKHFVITFGLLIAAASPADGQCKDLAWEKKGYEEFGMQAEIHTRAYINGFRNGYFAMFATQSQIEGGGLTETNAAVERFIDCLFVNSELSAIYNLMIADADNSPKMKLSTWLRKYFEKQCGDELKAAFLVPTGGEK